MYTYRYKTWLNVSPVFAATELPGIDFRNYRLPELFRRLNIQISCCVPTARNISRFRLILSVMPPGEIKGLEKVVTALRESFLLCPPISQCVYTSSSVCSASAYILLAQPRAVDKLCGETLKRVKERFAFLYRWISFETHLLVSLYSLKQSWDKKTFY